MPLLAEKELFCFRTKQCVRLRKYGRCDYGQRCQYSHSNEWPRRCPFYISDPTSLRYVPELCPDVVFKRRGEGGDEDMMPDLERTTVNEHEILVNACARGGGCPFCHSTEEYLYHPLKYKTELCHRYHTSNTAGPPHSPDSQQQPPSQPFGWNTSTSSSSSNTDRSAGQLPMRCQLYFCPFIHGVAENRRAQRTSDQRPIYKFKYRNRGSIGDGLDNLRRHNQQRHMREVTSSCSSSPACEGQRPMYQDAGEDAGDMQEGGANGAGGPVSPMEESVLKCLSQYPHVEVLTRTQRPPGSKRRQHSEDPPRPDPTHHDVADQHQPTSSVHLDTPGWPTTAPPPPPSPRHDEHQYDVQRQPPAYGLPPPPPPPPPPYLPSCYIHHGRSRSLSSARHEGRPPTPPQRITSPNHEERAPSYPAGPPPMWLPNESTIRVDYPIIVSSSGGHDGGQQVETWGQTFSGQVVVSRPFPITAASMHPPLAGTKAGAEQRPAHAYQRSLSPSSSASIGRPPPYPPSAYARLASARPPPPPPPVAPPQSMWPEHCTPTSPSSSPSSTRMTDTGSFPPCDSSLRATPPLSQQLDSFRTLPLDPSSNSATTATNASSIPVYCQPLLPSREQQKDDGPSEAAGSGPRKRGRDGGWQEGREEGEGSPSRQSSDAPDEQLASHQEQQGKSSSVGLDFLFAGKRSEGDSEDPSPSSPAGLSAAAQTAQTVDGREDPANARQPPEQEADTTNNDQGDKSKDADEEPSQPCQVPPARQPQEGVSSPANDPSNSSWSSSSSFSLSSPSASPTGGGLSKRMSRTVKLHNLDKATGDRQGAAADKAAAKADSSSSSNKSSSSEGGDKSAVDKGESPSLQPSSSRLRRLPPPVSSKPAEQHDEEPRAAGGSVSDKAHHHGGWEEIVQTLQAQLVSFAAGRGGDESVTVPQSVPQQQQQPPGGPSGGGGGGVSPLPLVELHRLASVLSGMSLESDDKSKKDDRMEILQHSLREIVSACIGPKAATLQATSPSPSPPASPIPHPPAVAAAAASGASLMAASGASSPDSAPATLLSGDHPPSPPFMGVNRSASLDAIVTAGPEEQQDTHMSHDRPSPPEPANEDELLTEQGHPHLPPQPPSASWAPLPPNVTEASPSSPCDGWTVSLSSASAHPHPQSDEGEEGQGHGGQAADDSGDGGGDGDGDHGDAVRVGEDIASAVANAVFS
ncbi:unnamed protein product [Vitrella brassicaformis CCMP3155]|uniref:C3H1-type domain-containing protein n=3 Tax=Vitrella brassicaformis TaxID=1169539 RepID=A0A0G4ENY4_VITBC|nr:unnamed protein product [Vitrella brassicaformis CCMP3155]|eukprot:CEL99156.1 unnamed protein product [Vitrella brassicaformis CCMP3155]